MAQEVLAWCRSPGSGPASLCSHSESAGGHPQRSHTGESIALHGSNLVISFCSVQLTHSLDLLGLKGYIYKHLLLIPLVYMPLHRKFSSGVVVFLVLNFSNNFSFWKWIAVSLIWLSVKLQIMVDTCSVQELHFQVESVGNFLFKWMKIPLAKQTQATRFYMPRHFSLLVLDSTTRIITYNCNLDFIFKSHIEANQFPG